MHQIWQFSKSHKTQLRIFIGERHLEFPFELFMDNMTAENGICCNSHYISSCVSSGSYNDKRVISELIYMAFRGN